MDKLDNKILSELMQNARVPLTTLAKKVRTSREVVTYRVQRLKDERIIQDFVTEVDVTKLGYVGAAVFLVIKTARENDFKETLKKTDDISWVAQLCGVWNFGLSIFGKTNDDVHTKFIKLYQAFKSDIIDYRFTFHKRSLFFYEKYFTLELKRSLKIHKVMEYKINKKDKQILELLSKNARMDATEIGRNIELTTPAVIHRVKKLEKSGYIKKYSMLVDISKLSLLQYSILVTTKNISVQEKFVHYLSEHPSVSFIAEYVGNPFLEFGIVVKNPYELRKVLQQIEEAFPDNRITEVSLFQKEFVSVGPPKCVFE